MLLLLLVQLIEPTDVDSLACHCASLTLTDWQRLTVSCSLTELLHLVFSEQSDSRLILLWYVTVNEFADCSQWCVDCLPEPSCINKTGVARVLSARGPWAEALECSSTSVISILKKSSISILIPFSPIISFQFLISISQKILILILIPFFDCNSQFKS